MATAVGIISGSGYHSWMNVKKGKNGNKEKSKVSCVYSPSITDPYKTLRIQPDASETDVRKAFRKLALQYHPDVCRGNNCGVQFHQINEAYDTVMSQLRGETPTISNTDMYDPQYECDADEMRGMNDPDYDLWEEWMGWEGAGIRDYTSHINPYI